MTPQVELWRGSFGDAYIDRNAPQDATLKALHPMWVRMLERARGLSTVLEVGANIGLNLRTLDRFLDADLTAVEPNAVARERLLADGVVGKGRAIDAVAKALPFDDDTFDLVFTAGVLIHVNPDDLARSCQEMHRVSRKYVLCAEYYSATPREVPYRGMGGQLFLRDFGAFWMQTCPDLKLVDYGFFWTGAGAVDNLTWWLFQKH